MIIITWLGEIWCSNLQRSHCMIPLPLLVLDAYFFPSGVSRTHAIMSFVAQHFKAQFSNLCFKWCSILISLVQEWCMGFFTSSIHPWLSRMMDVGISRTNFIAAKNCLSQMISVVHWLVIMYFTFIVDNAMISYLLHLHKITPTPTRNTCLTVDCRSFASPVQSTSQHHFKAISLPLRNTFKFKVSFKYLITAMQYGRPTLDIDLVQVLTAIIKL